MIFQVNALQPYVLYLPPCFCECQRARSIAKNKASDNALVIKLRVSWRETVVTLPEASCWSNHTTIKTGLTSVIIFLKHQKSDSFISFSDGLEALAFYSVERLAGYCEDNAPSGYYSGNMTCLK